MCVGDGVWCECYGDGCRGGASSAGGGGGGGVS